MKPSIGRIVHYVSYGTPGGEYKSECRAAIVTRVYTAPHCAPDGRVIEQREYAALAVLNPEGMFFNGGVSFHDGAGNPGDPNCPEPHADGPFRYCPAKGCGWTEPAHRGGTWHWPERTD